VYIYACFWNLTNPRRFLFAERRGADANFRMVRKKVSSEAADPTLSEGYSFFTEVKKYYNHLAKYGVQIEEVRQAMDTDLIIIIIISNYHSVLCA
jgi:hypothetical protein